MWSRPPIEEDCDIDNTESGMMFFLNLQSFCVPMYMCKINNKTWALLQQLFVEEHMFHLRYL
jgi:hypothetical protein